jgi:hypothetical protein
MAAAAGAEAVLFGGVAGGEENDLMPGGSAGGARRTAVNAGGTYCEDKLSVGIYLALLDGLPALVIEFDGFHSPTRYAGIQKETIRFLRSKKVMFTTKGGKGDREWIRLR